MATKKRQPTLPLQVESKKTTETEILLATILDELRGLRADFKSQAEKENKHLTGGY